MTLIPVKGHKGLFRDSETGAIINNNTNDYQTYITNRDNSSPKRRGLMLKMTLLS